MKSSMFIKQMRLYIAFTKETWNHPQPRNILMLLKNRYNLITHTSKTNVHAHRTLA
ncbi:hypothetical protein HanXRQr2_Chr16g0741921 [Helianthus annuus]|uniref:Uncharacterized protein n=1 Tax=Helianthus annuus TaxID=4232 RepID=A0A9K3GXR3_HELAN|nr:hypothetical protein HanXRQr2_Chr16g0741921 [Helianthus annuus]KAJ0820715.1 hypothetical protein HanPSC8_Chr16g0711321 [Helianthus annuus]